MCALFDDIGRKTHAFMRWCLAVAKLDRETHIREHDCEHGKETVWVLTPLKVLRPQAH